MAADAITLLIGGREFKNFLDFELTYGLDTYSTLTVTAPFEADRKEFRETFVPFSFKPIEVYLDLDLIFTGTMLTPYPQIEPEAKIVVVPAYAKPAVLGDCSPADSSLPVNFEKVNLRTISEHLTKPFGIPNVFDADPGAAFDKVHVDTEEKVQDFLANLARQRGLVMTDTPEGELLYWQTVTPGNAVARFVQGQAPFTRMAPTFNPQEYYSEITGYAKPKKKKGGGAKHTEPNPFLSSPLRPRTFKFEDSEKGDAPEATKGQLGRMFGNIVTWELPDLPTWRDPNGSLWAKNTTITATAPDAMIYSEFEFVIRNVTLRKTKDAKTATLQVVLPGAFSGEVPETLPWL